jgi:hypothetical protein
MGAPPPKKPIAMIVVGSKRNAVPKAGLVCQYPLIVSNLHSESSRGEWYIRHVCGFYNVPKDTPDGR